jgi:hypothetical protein
MYAECRSCGQKFKIVTEDQEPEEDFFLNLENAKSGLLESDLDTENDFERR